VLDKAEKLEILGPAARYDASCASSGSNRQGKKGGLGNASMGGICHTWTADGRCLSLLKVLMTNVCTFDCAYCMSRCSNDTPRTAFTPEELADITCEFYRRNYIEGLFLSSGVLRSPDYTMELMIKAMRLLREEKNFNGYIHVKAIPGSDRSLLYQAGLLADRISVNIELPSSESLRLLAPSKEPEAILTPMDHIKQLGLMNIEDQQKYKNAPMFAPAGQATQMIVGATPETDLTVMRLARGLYKKYKMRRVYYSAYIPVGVHPRLPIAGSPAPLRREHRLYQADFLMRFYHFEPDELADNRAPNLENDLDPKCSWALRHPEFYPVEVNTADERDLLRVPGVGQTSVARIIAARRQHRLSLEDLKKMGIVMKRAQYFLTANGRFCGQTDPGNPLLREILSEDNSLDGQLSLFTNEPLPGLPPAPSFVPGAHTFPGLLLP